MDVDDEPEDLGSPGFHIDPAELPPSELVSPPAESTANYTYPPPGEPSHMGYEEQPAMIFSVEAQSPIWACCKRHICQQWNHSTAAAGYGGYTQHPSARADIANNRVAYEPYTHNPPSAVRNPYTSYDSYNTRSANASSSTALSNPVAQGVTSSYANSSTAATAPSATQWGTANSASQPRNSHFYNANPHTSSGTSSYNGFSVRPTSTMQTRSSTARRFNQQSQPPPLQQPQQHRQQPQQQAQSYNSHSNQSHTGGGGHQN
ncbi:hypothetical protein B0T26DRAFT_676518 [Lasiosphaeria miniovina]|uniref:Uncharacterized protein n=1 Tax=Lasiosphaeria miniovina TaxID=1954250 RepID=A0AA40DYH9_9PEZI|nr:uncharacterized protein B0T26DRAFT_676518 [Lasiosphaeria miniovina]KAK0718342.1 hypothetical protein B0T26DRAFT_676518 [Lasiosphaeria miniovina]